MLSPRDLALELRKLKVGEAITVSRCTLELMVPIGPDFTAVDSIMENVIGSAFTMTATRDERTGDVTFRRCKEQPELRTYVSPDRRYLFSQRRDGLWERK